MLNDENVAQLMHTFHELYVQSLDDASFFG